MSNVLDFLKKNPTLAAMGTLGLAAAAVLVLVLSGDNSTPQPTTAQTAAAPILQSADKQTQGAGTEAERERVISALRAQGQNTDNPLANAMKQEQSQDASALLEQIFRKSREMSDNPDAQPVQSKGAEDLLEILRKGAKRQQAQQTETALFKATLITYLDDGSGAQADSSETELTPLNGDASPPSDQQTTEETAQAGLPKPVYLAVRFTKTASSEHVGFPQLLTQELVPDVDTVRMAQGGFGKVNLTLEIDDKGHVTTVIESTDTAVSAEGRRQLDRLKNAMSDWEFRPARVGTTNVPFQLQMLMPPQ